MVSRGGTVVLNGLPPGEFLLSISGMCLNGMTARGSIVGTRLDLQELLEFAAQGKVSDGVGARSSKTSMISSCACTRARSRAGSSGHGC